MKLQMKKTCEIAWGTNKEKRETKLTYGRVYNAFWIEIKMKGWMSNRIIKEHIEIWLRLWRKME